MNHFFLKIITKEFKEKSFSLKENFLSIIKNEVNAGSVIGAYGAPAKAFTLFLFLNLTGKLFRFVLIQRIQRLGSFFQFLIYQLFQKKSLKREIILS